MEHYITEIRIGKLRHLSDLVISLSQDSRQHLLITGKNGSGKTSLLLALQKYLQAVNDGNLNALINDYPRWLLAAQQQLEQAENAEEKFKAEKEYRQDLSLIEKYESGVNVLFCNTEDLDSLYRQGCFITAFFPANRKTEIARAHGVEEVRLSDFYGIKSAPGEILVKYMVHLKTQQAYARNEGDLENANRIQSWFERFENALKVLLDEETITLEYDYKEYNFKIHEKGKEPFGFDELSDGYSSVIHIVSDLILRMDKNWILGNNLSSYDIEGIVLIDELETHLHIELQKKILPFLTKFFPRIQFIVTTHSPYILNSISNVKAYDLEKCIELENLSVFSADQLAESYFEVDEYAEELKEKLVRYEYLVNKNDVNEEEKAERAELRIELRKIPQGLSLEAREKFEEIERKRL